MSVAQSPRLKKQDRYDWDHRVRAENPHAFRKNWPKKKARSRRIGRHRENTAIVTAVGLEDLDSTVRNIEKPPKCVKTGVMTLREWIEDRRRTAHRRATNN